MKKMDVGLERNNYISCIEVRNLFKGLDFKCDIKNINVSGQKRGCSGFITNLNTGKVCYITTEPFFDRGRGSGLFGNTNEAVMMRTAKDTKDYTGGYNQWLPASDIVATAQRLTE